MDQCITNPDLKQCSKCREWKPATTEHFYGNRMGKNGLRSVCRECDSRRSKTYYRDHRDNYRQGAIAYRLSNLERIKAYQQQWYLENRLHVLETTKRNHRNKREMYRDIKHAWLEKNPHKQSEYARRRRARTKNVPYTLTAHEWEACLRWFDYKCAVCGRGAGFWHRLAQDHWIPMAKGGATTADNIIPLCHGIKDGDGGCNRDKSANDPSEWLNRKFGKRKARSILKRIQAYFDSLK